MGSAKIYAYLLFAVAIIFAFLLQVFVVADPTDILSDETTRNGATVLQGRGGRDAELEEDANIGLDEGCVCGFSSPSLSHLSRRSRSSSR